METQFKTLYINLAKLVYKYGEKERRVNPENSYELTLVSYLSEFEVIFERTHGEKKFTPIAVTFTVFDEDFLLTQDGEIVVMNEDENELYNVTDPEILKELLHFLKWRMIMIKDLNF